MAKKEIGTHTNIKVYKDGSILVKYPKGIELQVNARGFVLWRTVEGLKHKTAGDAYRWTIDASTLAADLSFSVTKQVNCVDAPDAVTYEAFEKPVSLKPRRKNNKKGNK